MRLPVCLAFGATVLVLLRTARAVVPLPAPDHIVILIEENRSDTDVYGNPNYPWFNSLANNSAGINAAKFTGYAGITHPSQPNYLALFGGSTLGITDNEIHPFSTFSGASNLGAKLINSGRSYASYSEDLPAVGSQAEFANGTLYARKHNPTANWQDASIAAANQLPASSNRPFFARADWPASDFSQLPTVSIVVPNQNNDGHNTFDHTADNWYHDNVLPYASWATLHNSLLVITWDEDEGTGLVATVFAGPMVKPGVYGESTSHYGLLRTIEDMYSLSHDTVNTQNTTTITDVWIPEPEIIGVLCAGLLMVGRRYRNSHCH